MMEVSSMSAGQPRWIRGLGQWLLCGLAGAAVCLVAALVFNGTGYLPALWGAPVLGFEWGLIGGLELGIILWLFGRVSRGVRPGELILAAVCMCALPTVVNLWLELTLSRLLRHSLLWEELPVLHDLQSMSYYLEEQTAVMFGAYGGVIAAAALWGWPKRPRRTGARNAVLCALVPVAVACLVFWGLLRPARDHAREASCMSNQKSLGLAFLMYARDYNDRLPLGQTSLELLGVDRAKYGQAPVDPLHDPLLKSLGGGPMDAYSKNHGIWFCPSDMTRRDWRGRLIWRAEPEPGVSYLWHASLAGRKLKTIPVVSEEWLLRDREPWHNGTRVVVFANGHSAREGAP